MSSHGTSQRMRPPPGQVGSTPFRSSSNNRFQSSLVPMSRPSPARPFQPQSKPSGFSSTTRDLFRSSTPKSARSARFAPNLPADATNASPGGRKYLPQKSVMGGMTSTASADLFKMRIPSPDPELTGEALAREVPQDPNRKGSIYADQFLSYKCPPHFDELQRRQFFCILDLRRLKYAADEIFAKKDWKLNILNFAREYEKSRGLILLRYGLYEFKKVKPSEEVLKRWRKTHNLPEPEPETEENQPRRNVGGTTGATKRKAEDDLAPKDNALMASSTANQNKRRNVEPEESDPALKGPAPFKKSKRKTDVADEPDENQLSKTPKAAPSAAQSKFESILNKTQSPAKRAPLGASSMASNPFGAAKSTETETSATTKSNPFGTSTTATKSSTSVFSNNNGAGSTGSILSNHQPGMKLAANPGNVFGYLSESSAQSSSNENNDGSDSEPEETESQDVAPSYEPSAAASTGTNTPPTQNGSSMFPTDPFALFKKAAKPVGSANNDASSLFKNPSNPAEPTSTGGLFDRVQKGTDGQPLRGTPGAEDEPAAPASIFGAPKESAQPPKKSLGGDFTYDASSTPIKFGSTPTSKDVNGTAPTPAPQPPKQADEAAETAAATPSIFGFQPQKSQPAPPSIFGASKPAGTNGAASIFGAQKTPATPAGLPGTSSSLFQGFGKSQNSDTPAAKPPASIFGQKPADAAAEKPATPLFGNANKETDSDASKPSFGSENKSSAASIFGANASNGAGVADKSKSDKPVTAAPIFGAQSTASSTPVFGGGSKRRATDDDDPPAKKPATSLFGGGAPGSSSVPKFAGAEGTSSPLFGNTQPTQPEKSDAMTAPKNMFGSTPAATTGESKPTQPIFSFGSDAGNAAKPAATAAPIFSFGGSTNNAPSQPPTFGGGSTTPAASNSFDFNFSGGGGGTSNGNSSTPFQFGQSTSGGSGTFNFGAGGGTPATPTANFSFGQQQSTPQQASTTPAASFSFGQQQSAPQQASTTPAASFSFGQQQSTPQPASTTPAPSIFGGLSNGTGSQPSFNFTSATPTQNTSGANDTKPASIFGGLAPSGGTGTNSPMFAPSSMGTTPAGGTPEPQSKPDDGEEAPQEQVSLTNGGPGEEDEEIVHEVRAKAMKFVPLSKDSDDEGSDKKKSPWTTMGVGPLRVLKNKSTGSVRILLRAEPRGHIAMNKTILADVQYKATQKTINFAAASDDGSGLETWVLQVKKPESAQELAGVLEANKSANKK